MAINYDSKPCNNELIRKVRQIHGTAAPQPGQGARTSDSGAGGCASSVNSRNTLPPLFGTAKEQPNQGARTSDSGAGGCASLEGRGTMEQK